MHTALDVYLAAGQHSLQAQRELAIASFGLGFTLWADAVAPFYRSAAEAFAVCAKLAFPQLRAGDVVLLGPVREAKHRRAERRALALRG